MRTFVLALILFIPLSVFAEEKKGNEKGERIYIVNGYRYVQGSPDDDQEIGHSLCGTRCNALSSNYRNIMEPGGWNITRISRDSEILVELGNPLIGGHCLCLADEYQVRHDDRIRVLKDKSSVAGKF